MTTSSPARADISRAISVLKDSRDCHGEMGWRAYTRSLAHIERAVSTCPYAILPTAYERQFETMFAEARSELEGARSGSSEFQPNYCLRVLEDMRETIGLVEEWTPSKPVTSYIVN